MATTTNITTTYAGQDSMKWVSQALLSGNTLANNLITIRPNIKYKEVIHRFEQTGVLQDASCDFTPNGSVTLTERYLQPKELQLNKVLCKNDFRSTWEAIEMGYSAHDVLPKSFADYMLAHQVRSVAASIETSIWNGSAAVSGEFDGFVTLLETDASLPSAQEVAGTTVDASDVVVELTKILTATPTRLLLSPDFKIYVSKNIQMAYIASLGGYGASGLGANGYQGQGQMWYNNQPLYFQGYEIVVANGLPADTAIATTKDNLFFGCGLMNNQNECKVLDMSDIDGSDNVRIVMKMTAAVNYAIVQDVVTYGITNGAN